MASMTKLLDLISEYQKAKESGDNQQASRIAYQAEGELKGVLGLRGGPI